MLASAPAGFGKTTLVADWLRAAGEHAAWLALEPRDSDIARFERRLLAAVLAAARIRPEPDARDAETAFDTDVAVDGLIAALEAGCAVGHGIVVVLDDYHVITSPAVHRLVASLVDRLPAGARVAIASRTDPPLPLARLRAAGELLEVRADDLRFTPDEASELLRQADLELPADSIASLTSRTEGWAAALRLAAISLQGRPDPVGVVERFGATHRFLLDYVLEEVLGNLPAEAETFLLRTSILGRLSGPVCDAVTGGTDGQARLEALERANLLIIPLDDERIWYRYHALFADILRVRLAILRPDEVTQLHRRASAWWESEGDVDEAIAHALSAGDTARAAALIADAWRWRLNAGEIGTVRGWLDQLPGESFGADPRLSVAYAWCLGLAGETDGIVRRLDEAEAALADHPELDPVAAAGVRIQVALIRSRSADLLGDAETALQQARLAGELLPLLPPTTGASLRGIASAFIANALRRAGDLVAAKEVYRAALPDLRVGANPTAVARAIADLAAIAIEQGDPLGALRMCEEELDRRGAGATATASGALWVAVARARLELGDLDAAEHAARRALDLARRAGDTSLHGPAEQTLAGIAEARTRSGAGNDLPPAAPGRPDRRSSTP